MPVRAERERLFVLRRPWVTAFRVALDARFCFRDGRDVVALGSWLETIRANPCNPWIATALNAAVKLEDSGGVSRSFLPASELKNRLARRDATFTDMVYHTANDFVRVRADQPYQSNPINGV